MKALRVITSGGGEATLDEATVREFAASLRGPVLLTGDGDYDEARKLFNGMIDHRPALITRCMGTPTSSRRYGSRESTICGSR